MIPGTEGLFQVRRTARSPASRPSIARSRRRAPSGVSIPRYDRASVRPRIVHLGAEPSTILSCDNLPGNGQVLRLAMDGSRKIPNMIARPLAETIRAGRPMRAMALALQEIFGTEIPRSAAFVETLAGSLGRLYAEGARATLRKFLRGG